MAETAGVQRLGPLDDKASSIPGQMQGARAAGKWPEGPILDSILWIPQYCSGVWLGWRLWVGMEAAFRINRLPAPSGRPHVVLGCDVWVGGDPLGGSSTNGPDPDGSVALLELIIDYPGVKPLVRKWIHVFCRCKCRVKSQLGHGHCADRPGYPYSEEHIHGVAA